MSDARETDHWLARPSTIRLLWRVFIAVLMALVTWVVPDIEGLVFRVALVWWVCALVWTLFYPTPIPGIVRWIAGALVLLACAFILSPAGLAPDQLTALAISFLMPISFATILLGLDRWLRGLKPLQVLAFSAWGQVLILLPFILLVAVYITAAHVRTQANPQENRKHCLSLHLSRFPLKISHSSITKKSGWKPIRYRRFRARVTAVYNHRRYSRSAFPDR